MERSLEQNQQSIALNMGQVAIAGRNAKTAEDTLGEIKKGGTDTHDLAVAAKDQAAAAKLQVGEMKKQETQTHQLAVQAGKQAEAAKLQADNTREALKHSDDAFQISEKPYVVLGRKDGVIGELRDAKGTSDSPGIDIYLQNSGHLPALNVCVSVQVSPDPSIGAQPFYENNSLTRLKDQSGPMRYHVMSEGNCADIAGDSVARHYVAKPFNQATLDRIRAAPLPIPLFVSTFVQYCTPFGEYRCVQNLLKYEKAPLDGFVSFGQDDACTNLYGRSPELFRIGPSQEYVHPCDKPGEAEQRRKDEDRAYIEEQDAKAKAKQKP